MEPPVVPGGSRRGIEMRIVSSLLAAALLAGLSVPAAAQLPQGSYLRSCRDARLEGHTLVAVCRGITGSWERTVLPEIGRCVGDIANVDGALRCRRGGAFPPPPPYNAERERRAECGRIEHAISVTRARLEHMPPGDEHERFERRLHELRTERRHRCGG
jgi:hypothetical protein